MRDLLVVAAAGAAIWVIQLSWSVVAPVLAGLCLAYVCNPLISRCERRLCCPRPLAAAALVIGSVAGLLGFLLWLAPLIVAQFTLLADNLPAYMEAIEARTGFDLSILASRLEARILRNPEGSLRSLSGIVDLLGDVMVWLFLVPTAFFFFSWQLPRVWRGLWTYVPASRRADWQRLARQIDAVVGDWVRSRLLLSALVSLLFSAAYLAAEVPYWFLLGTVTGILSAVPYVSVLGWLAALAVKYVEAPVEASWLAVFLWPSIAYWGVNMLEEWVLAPWLQGRSLDLSAFSLLVVVLIGGALAGIWGLLLSVPLAAATKVVVRSRVLPRLSAWAARA